MPKCLAQVPLPPPHPTPPPPVLKNFPFVGRSSDQDFRFAKCYSSAPHSPPSPRPHTHTHTQMQSLHFWTKFWLWDFRFSKCQFKPTLPIFYILELNSTRKILAISYLRVQILGYYIAKQHAEQNTFEGNYVFTDISLGPEYCSLLSCYLFIQQQLRDTKFSKYNYKHNCTLNLWHGALFDFQIGFNLIRALQKLEPIKLTPKR